MAHFLSNMSSSHCSLRSLAVFCSLLQHLSFKMAFYFHLVSRPPLCSQSPWHVSQLLPLPTQKGESQWGRFSARDWAWPPTWDGMKHGGSPWTARSLPRQQLRGWSIGHAGGQPASFPYICASRLEALLHPNVGGHPVEPLWSMEEKRCQICFARSLAQVV